MGSIQIVGVGALAVVVAGWLVVSFSSQTTSVRSGIAGPNDVSIRDAVSVISLSAATASARAAAAFANASSNTSTPLLRTRRPIESATGSRSSKGVGSGRSIPACTTWTPPEPPRARRVASALWVLIGN